MRSLQRRKQDIWLTKATRSDEHIEDTVTYSKPEKHRVTVSNSSGNPREIAAGLVSEYSRYFISYDRDFRPEEGMSVFVDKIPELDSEGELVLDSDGVPVTLPDYVITTILDTARGTIARYGMKKIAGDGE